METVLYFSMDLQGIQRMKNGYRLAVDRLIRKLQILQYKNYTMWNHFEATIAILSLTCCNIVKSKHPGINFSSKMQCVTIVDGNFYVQVSDRKNKLSQGLHFNPESIESTFCN
ncbi:hypothetical protein ACF0H5_002743 [Mactra antiquata]